MRKIRIAAVTVIAAGAALAGAGPAFASTPHYGPPTKPGVPAWCKPYQDNGKNQKWDNGRDRCCPETVKVIKVRGRWEVVNVRDGRDCIPAPKPGPSWKPQPGPSWTQPGYPKPSWTQPGPSWKPTPTPTWTGTKPPKPGPTWTPHPHPTGTGTVTPPPWQH